MYILKFITDDEYQKLIKSHQLFSCGLQLYDDIFDVQEDFVNKQSNFALGKLNEIYPALEKNEPVVLQKLVHIRGISVELLKLSIDYFKEALLMIKDIKCSLWEQTINAKVNEVQIVLNNTDFYIESIKIKLKLSNEKIKDDFIFNQVEINKRISLSINFIAKEQEENGEWRDTPVNAWLSGYWTTGYVLNAISEIGDNELLKIDRLKAIKYLLSNKTVIYPYIEGWIEDADSTNFSLLGLLSNKIDIKNQINELLKYQLPNGGFATYNNASKLLKHLNDLTIKDVSGWTQEHICVSAATLLLLSKINGYEIEKEKLVDFIISKYNKNELFESYWWTSSIYATSLIIEANLILKHPKLSIAMEEIMPQFLLQIQMNGLCKDNFSKKHVFYTSLMLHALCICNKNNLYKNIILQITEALLNMQNKDGSWDSSYALRIPPANCLDPDSIKIWKKSDLGESVLIEDIHRIITTVSVLRALNKVNQLFLNELS